MSAADAADQRGAWQAVADRTTGPGTHPAIIEASGGHPDSRPAEGDEIEVPGFDDAAYDRRSGTERRTRSDASDEPERRVTARRAADREAGFGPR